LHFGIEVVPFGPYSDPRRILKLAVAAENARWEAIWLWDHILCPFGAGDPWIALAAAAASTDNLKLVTGVAPLSRYRPHLLARMLAGLASWRLAEKGNGCGHAVKAGPSCF
jgi:alkanesulfonate monooxygenase SsuD/methylene tetrahydromethanopterin reductase-like flavin-dependent oxidoreductase (luciferase family)